MSWYKPDKQLLIRLPIDSVYFVVSVGSYCGFKATRPLSANRFWFVASSQVLAAVEMALCTALVLRPSPVMVCIILQHKFELRIFSIPSTAVSS